MHPKTGLKIRKGENFASEKGFNIFNMSGGVICNRVADSVCKFSSKIERLESDFLRVPKDESQALLTLYTKNWLC